MQVERVQALFFLYTSLLAVLLPLDGDVRTRTLLANTIVLTGFAIVRRQQDLRNWYPVPLVLLAYREMGWFAQPIALHTLEANFIGTDRFVLYSLGLKHAVEFFGPAFETILEFCYVLASPMPVFALSVLYAYDKRGRCDVFLYPFVTGCFLSYALFPWFPSEPPRVVFAGQDLPRYYTWMRDLNLTILNHAGIHTSVFPSAHCSAAFSAAFGLRRALPERPWVWSSFLVVACGILIATVYGRYHFVWDSLAGLVVAAVALRITRTSRPVRAQAS